MKRSYYDGEYFDRRSRAIRLAHHAGQITGREKWGLLWRAHYLSLIPPQLSPWAG